MTVNVYKMAIFNDVYYVNTSLLRNTVNPSVFRGYQPLVSRRLASSTNNDSMESHARLFTLDKSTILLYEWGVRMPCIDTIKDFADYYNVSVDILMHSDSTKLEKMIEKRRRTKRILWFFSRS